MPSAPASLSSPHEEGRLEARASAKAATGLLPLRLGNRRDGFLFVPESYQATEPVPLVAMLHGAGGDARQVIDFVRHLADERGFLVLATDSRGRTWDLILDGLGPDVAFLDAALNQVFRYYAVDPKRVFIGGFSDGGSYALSLGMTNGDLFNAVLAFSPGFAAPMEQVGAPRVYISHGSKDPVLPVERCGRRLAGTLKEAGYNVRYHEFDGPHTVPNDIVEEALGWAFRPEAEAERAE